VELWFIVSPGIVFDMWSSGSGYSTGPDMTGGCGAADTSDEIKTKMNGLKIIMNRGHKVHKVDECRKSSTGQALFIFIPSIAQGRYNILM
jgi:hypothetical protein